MPSGTPISQTLPAAERLKIIVDRQLNLKFNKPGHRSQERAQMMRRNELTLGDLMREVRGGQVL
jgi:hypothetical protein